MRMIRPTSFAALLITFGIAANGQEQPNDDDLAGPLDQTVPVAEEGAEVADESIEPAGTAASGQEQADVDDFAGPLDQTGPVTEEGAEVADESIEADGTTTNGEEQADVNDLAGPLDQTVPVAGEDAEVADESIEADGTTASGEEQADVDDLAGPLDQTVPVAEEGADIAEQTADIDSSDELTEQDLLQEFARFRQLLEEQNFDEADVSAKRVVEMAIRLHGPQSHETAKALNNLAIVQHNNQQYEAATQNFMASIEIIENLEDRLNPELVNPLKGLGAAQLGNGRPDLASKSFDRATHITHVNEGPHNLEQVEILESLAEAKVRMGDVETARDILDRIHILNVRHFQDDALGLLPSLMRRASWQHRSGYFNDERATYRRAIRIIETSVGKEDPRLVDPLLKLGESFYYFEPAYETGSIQNANSGETYFRRAVRIAEKAEDFPWLELATTRLQLADFYTYRESHHRARKIYQEVWNDLSADEDRLEMRKELLEQPVVVRAQPPPRYATENAGTTRSKEAFQTGTIRVDYTVSERGRVRNIRTEAKPAEFTDMQRMVHRELRRRVFRPQLEDGIPVVSGNQVFEHEFLYRQSDLDELRATGDEDGEADEGSE